MLKSLTMMVDLLLYPCSSNKINFICFKAILLVTIYLELLHLFGELNSELNYLSLFTLFILSVINTVPATLFSGICFIFHFISFYFYPLCFPMV